MVTPGLCQAQAKTPGSPPEKSDLLKNQMIKENSPQSGKEIDLKGTWVPGKIQMYPKSRRKDHSLISIKLI